MPSKEEAKEHLEDAHEKLKDAHAAVSKHVSKALESEHAEKAKAHAKAMWSSLTSWFSETTGMKDEVAYSETLDDIMLKKKKKKSAASKANKRRRERNRRKKMGENEGDDVSGGDGWGMIPDWDTVKGWFGA